MQNKALITIGVVILVVLIVFSSFVYTVKETEQVVITQFGEPKREVVTAGLHFKTPMIEKVSYFEKRILEWDGKPTQVPTLDKRYIWVDSFARWRIAEPLKYLRRVRNETSAHNLLDDLINGAVRNQITNHIIIEVIRSSNRPMQIIEGLDDEQAAERSKIEKGRGLILEQALAEAKASVAEYGIELVDVRVKRINYVEQVRRAVYERMIVERQRIAAKFRSEGEGEMMDIRGRKEKEEKQILSEAYRQAEEIKGKADAEAIKIYADAYSKDPEFYSFLETLKSYETNLGQASTVILSTDSDYLKYLKTPSQ